MDELMLLLGFGGLVAAVLLNRGWESATVATLGVAVAMFWAAPAASAPETNIFYTPPIQFERTLLVINKAPDTLHLYVANEQTPSLHADIAPGQATCLVGFVERLTSATPYLYAEVGKEFVISPPLIGGLLQGDPINGTAREVNLVTDNAEWVFYPTGNVWSARWEACQL